MSETVRIRVTLRWVQILDNKEPFYKERGEFFFRARVKGDGKEQETRIPQDGYFEISDHPSWNKVNLDRVLFDGPVGSRLAIELIGEEVDMSSPNDRLELYKRVFAGDSAAWLGEHSPHDEDEDPENLKDWRVCYRIERV
jgi:hypothetical protein